MKVNTYLIIPLNFTWGSSQAGIVLHSQLYHKPLEDIKLEYASYSGHCIFYCIVLHSQLFQTIGSRQVWRNFQRITLMIYNDCDWEWMGLFDRIMTKWVCWTWLTYRQICLLIAASKEKISQQDMLHPLLYCFLLSFSLEVKPSKLLSGMANPMIKFIKCL